MLNFLIYNFSDFYIYIYINYNFISAILFFLILMKKIIYLSLFIMIAILSMSYGSVDLDFEDDIESDEPIEDPTIEVPINSR